MRLFQLTESELEYLERELPKLMDYNLESCNDRSVRLKWGRIKEILSDVRWGHGPPIEVTRIPTGDDDGA